MIRTIGIDLGTFNSAAYVVVEGRVEQVDLPDEGLLRSAVWSDGGTVLCGRDAANRMGESPSPLLEFKRHMGFDSKLDLCGREVGAVEVSGIFLRELRAKATSVLGAKYGEDRVDLRHAVISHPARFGVAARCDTTEAGMSGDMGFDRVDLIPEPVAAAVAYSYRCSSDELEEGSIYYLIFDFGGGTLDVAIVERDDEGTLDVIDYDGDQWLGGAEFDECLANRLVDKINDGKTVGADYLFVTASAAQSGAEAGVFGRDPSRSSAFSTLCYRAEQLKKSLSEGTEASVSFNGELQDDRNKPIQGTWTLTRNEFEASTGKLMDRAHAITERILAKQAFAFPGTEPLAPDAFDDLSDEDRRSRAKANAAHVEVLLVGGSCRMPMIGEMFRERFDREGALVAPDLIVAEGAAQQGRLMNPLRTLRTQSDDVALKLSCPQLTNKADDFRVWIELDGPAGEYELVMYDDQGNEPTLTLLPGTPQTAYFELYESQVNEIGFELTGPDGEELLDDCVQIEHSPTVLLPRPVDVTNALPVRVALKQGLHTLVPANSQIPHSNHCTLMTADHSEFVLLTFFEGERCLGEVPIANTRRRAGAKLRLTFTLREDYRFDVKIQGEGVPDDDIQFRLAKAKVLRVREVPAKLEDLKCQFDDAASNWEGTRILDLHRASAEQIHEEVTRELRRYEPRPGYLSDCLASYRHLIERLNHQQPLEPHWDEVRKRRCPPDMDKETVSEWREAVEKAREAWEHVDRGAYASAVESLDEIELYAKSMKVVGPDETDDTQDESRDETEPDLTDQEKYQRLENAGEIIADMLNEAWSKGMATHRRTFKAYYHDANLREEKRREWEEKNDEARAAFLKDCESLREKTAALDPEGQGNEVDALFASALRLYNRILNAREAMVPKKPGEVVEAEDEESEA